MGFVDSTGLIGVDLNQTPMTAVVGREQSTDVVRHISAMSALTGAGVSAAVTLVFAGLMVKAKADFDSTQLQKPARRASDRFAKYEAMTAISSGAAVVLGGIAWFLWPEPQDQVNVRISAARRAHGAELFVTVDF